MNFVFFCYLSKKLSIYMQMVMETNETQLMKDARNESRLDMCSPSYYNIPMHLFPASAGSGKTYRLSYEYLCLLLKSGERKLDNYRHVLAITFTNKATAEMKERILKNLGELADGTADADYVDMIAKRLSIDAQEVKSRAGKVYRFLLHDFSHFSVETIDAFFQRVIRNMAHELHIGTGWNVELDIDRVKTLAVRRLLNKTKNDEVLRSWVEQYMNRQLEEGRDWNVRKELEDFAKNVFNEHLQTNPDLETFFGLPLDERRKQIGQLIDFYDDLLKRHKSLLQSENGKILKLLNNNGLEATRNVQSFFNKISKKDYDYTKTITDLCACDPQSAENSVFTKTTLKQKGVDFNGIAVKIQQSCQKMIKLIDELRNAGIVNSQLYQVGLFADLYECVKEIQQEENIFMLSFAQPLLNKMIGKEDAPFIYEKIGSVLRYMMIDEFQDTSEVQFHNFVPLIENCCGQNSGSLVVGDAKQGIYRFRGGDWRLIDKLLRQADHLLADNERELTTNLQRHAMQFNYRSAKNVVSFNNALFSVSDSEVSFGNITLNQGMVSIAQRLLNEKLKTTRDELTRVYTDSSQFCPNDVEGYVKVLLQKKKSSKNKQNEDSEEEDSSSSNFLCNTLIEEVRSLLEKGVRQNDILILVRKNKMIPLIAACLRENGIEVASTEAFMLGSSLRVRLIIDALRYIDAHFSYVKSERRKDDLYKLALQRDWNSLENKAPLADRDDLEEMLKRLYDENWKNGEQSEDDDKELICRLPLMEMAQRIHYLFMPDKPFDEYEYCFFDHLRDYVGKRMVSLGDFLNYWDEKLISVKIPGGAQKVAGVEVLSIHKSKGLERHSVILADCNWKLNWEKTPTVWCELKKDGVSKLHTDAPVTSVPLLPIAITDKLASSPFCEDYRDELVQGYVENVNLLYVALTRAVNNLIVIGEIGNANSVGNLLAEALKDSEYSECEEEDDTRKNATKGAKVVTSLQFEIGDVVKSKEEKALPVVPQVTLPDTFEDRGRFNQSASSRRFVQACSASANSAVEKGLFYHALFEGIDCFRNPKEYQELKDAAEGLFQDGVINEEQKNQCLSDIDLFMKNLDEQYVSGWFGEHLTVWNECPIMVYTGDELDVQRPDRLVYDPASNTYIVVDFKTGGRSSDHQNQVRDYMNLVAKMRPDSTIKGYLWYIFEEGPSNVVEVGF